MKQFKQEYEKVNKLKLAETGQELTEAEAWEVYYTCFLKDLRNNNFEGYEPGELEALQEYREATRKRFLESPEMQELLKTVNPETPELFNFADYEKLSLKNAYLCNSKVANELVNISKDSEIGDKTKINIAPPKKETVCIIAFFGDNEKTYIKGEPLNPFDTVVHRAICSLWEAGKQENKKEICFNLQQVYRAMNGTNDSNINYEVLEKIKTSIEKSIRNRLVLDCTEQFKKWKNGRKPKNAEYETYLLPLDRIKLVMQNGEQIEGYKFIKCPPLYAYSKDIGQIINIPISLLDTNSQGQKNRLSNTTENIVIRELLIKQIAIYKNDKNKIINSLINYNNLFESAGLDVTQLDRVQQKRKRETVKKLLDHFITEGFIKGYLEYKEGQSIKGVEVSF